MSGPGLMKLSEAKSLVLKDNLQKQHPIMRRSLGVCKVPLDRFPSFDEIEAGLTPEILDVAHKMEDPILNITSPLNRFSLLSIWNRIYRKRTKEKRLLFPDYNNREIWNEDTVGNWEVDIVEGKDDSAFLERLRKRIDRSPKKTLRDQVLLYREEFTKQGFSIMSGARKYICWVMRNVEEGRDKNLPDGVILNGNTLKRHGDLAVGSLDTDSYILEFGKESDVLAHEFGTSYSNAFIIPSVSVPLAKKG